MTDRPPESKPYERPPECGLVIVGPTDPLPAGWSSTGPDPVPYGNPPADRSPSAASSKADTA